MWNELVKRVMQKQSEQEALAEPSVMDEYIKQNDPNQWATILLARQRQNAVDAAMQGGPTVGSIKIKPLLFPEDGGKFIAKKDIKDIRLLREKVASGMGTPEEIELARLQSSLDPNRPEMLKEKNPLEELYKTSPSEISSIEDLKSLQAKDLKARNFLKDVYEKQGFSGKAPSAVKNISDFEHVYDVIDNLSKEDLIKMIDQESVGGWKKFK